MTSDNDPEELIGGLHTNLTAVAEAVDAIEAERSAELKALGAALSGNRGAAERALKGNADDDAADFAELFAESFELSLKIADALDVPEGELSGGADAESSSSLGTVARALGGEQ
jgi:hypothetical protein